MVSHCFPAEFMWHKMNPEMKKIMVVLGLALLVSIIMISNTNIVFSQSPAKGSTTHGVKIQTPSQGNEISIGNDNLTIAGKSVDDESSDCQVLVIVNDIKPYQKAASNGLNGANDYSKWEFTLSPDYTKLKEGSNKITAKLDCKDELDVLKYDTIIFTATMTNPSGGNNLNSQPTEDISGTEQNRAVDVHNAEEKFNQTQELVNETTSYDNSSALQQPNMTTSISGSTLNAQNIYGDKKMILSPDVAYLVILIPNEGHESLNQPKNQLPLINQPYVPQNVMIYKSTGILWLNADVGHRHKISLNDSNSKIFESGIFGYNTTSKPLTLNKTGAYQYWESHVSKEVPDFVMKGAITVTSQMSTDNTASQNGKYIVGTNMVPAKFIDKYRSGFEDKGFNIDSTFTYKDLRGGQKGTGPEQTLIVWETHNLSLEEVISALEELTPTLPYN